MGGRLLLPLSLAAKMKGEGTGKVGRCFSMRGCGGGEGEENYGGGEINPLRSKVEVNRPSPPNREWRRTPPPTGEEQISVAGGRSIGG